MNNARIAAPDSHAFIDFLFLVLFTMTVVFATHTASLPKPQIYRPATPAVKHAVAAKHATPVQPSAFALETAMTPSALMKRWDSLISEAALTFGVPERWIRAVMRQESGGRTMLGENQPIISSAGAVGLMQVMPQTYAEMRAQYRLGADPFDPHDNIFAGAAYLHWLQAKYGFPAMFAAYNAGPGTLEDHLAKGTPLPAETQAYVVRVAGYLSDKLSRAASAFGTAMLTRPDGTALKVDKSAVRAVRAAMPGEYADGVLSVITIGKQRQGVRESVAAASAAVGTRVRAVY